MDLLADFNARLRDLHRRSEQLQKKPLAQWRKAEGSQLRALRGAVRQSEVQRCQQVDKEAFS